MSQDDATLRDEEWDSRYFGLINELAEKNASRYESQTDELLKKRFLCFIFKNSNHYY